MLVVDLLLLVGAATLLVVGAGALGGRFGRERLERRQREAQGKKNAEDERRRLLERCAVCDRPVDAATDLWEKGQWWHRSCWRQSVGDGEASEASDASVGDERHEEGQE